MNVGEVCNNGTACKAVGPTANLRSPGAALTARDTTGRERTDMASVVGRASDDVTRDGRLRKIDMDDILEALSYAMRRSA